MNDARFSMRLPQPTLDFVQGYAAQCQTSVTELVLQYFERLQSAATARTAKKRRFRDLSKYRGIVRPAMDDREVDDLLSRNVLEKYA